jgi:hypothetical protein
MRPLWSYGVDAANTPDRKPRWAGGMVLFIRWRAVAEESGAAHFGFGGAMLLDLMLGPPGRCSGCWPHDGEVAGGAVADSILGDLE